MAALAHEPPGPRSLEAANTRRGRHLWEVFLTEPSRQEMAIETLESGL